MREWLTADGDADNRTMEDSIAEEYAKAVSARL